MEEIKGLIFCTYQKTWSQVQAYLFLHPHQMIMLQFETNLLLHPWQMIRVQIRLHIHHHHQILLLEQCHQAQIKGPIHFLILRGLGWLMLVIWIQRFIYPRLNKSQLQAKKILKSSKYILAAYWNLVELILSRMII